MDKIVYNVLKKIEDSGFEAYIVGGFVRDYLLNKESFDVDICTNALPKDLINIFDIKTKIKYGSVSINQGDYTFDITTYRKEGKYNNHNIEEVIYINNLIEDIKRRDFTINTICMNKEGNIIDLLDGRKDLDNHLIRIVGDLEEKLTTDPLRILRALRLSITLDFKLDEELLTFIKNNKYLLKEVSYFRKKEELEKIFISKYLEKGLKFLKTNDLLSLFEINYDKITVVPNILGIWAQLDYSSNYQFSKNHLNSINEIKNIIKGGIIDNNILFKYDYIIVLTAGNILGFNSDYINDLYQKMPIKKPSDVDIKTEDIINLLSLEDMSLLSLIKDDIIKEILNNQLINEYGHIKDYLLKKWK